MVLQRIEESAYGIRACEDASPFALACDERERASEIKIDVSEAERSDRLDEQVQVGGIVGKDLRDEPMCRIIVQVTQIARAYGAVFDPEEGREIVLHTTADTVVQVAVDLFGEPL